MENWPIVLLLIYGTYLPVPLVVFVICCTHHADGGSLTDSTLLIMWDHRGNYSYLQVLGLGKRSGSTQRHWDQDVFFKVFQSEALFSSASTQSEACLFFCNSAGDGINTKHIYIPVDEVFPSLESNKIKRSGSTQPLWDKDVFFSVYPFSAHVPNQRPVYFFATVPAME